MAFFEKFAGERPWLGRRWSLSMRLVVIGFLMLVFLYPLSLVRGVIIERTVRHQEAVREVSSKWGDAQTLAGPVLVVPYYPYARQIPKGLADTSQARLAYFIPENLNITGKVQSEIRTRGIYRVPLYTGDLRLEGEFAAPELSTLGLSAGQMFWDKAYVTLGGLDLSGLNSQIVLHWGATGTKNFEATVKSKLFNSEVIALATLTPEKPSSQYPFSITLKARGSGGLFFVPAAKETKVEISSDWRSPSFDGAFLPASHTINEQGFTATWQVLDLNRNLPPRWTDSQTVALNSAVVNSKNRAITKLATGEYEPSYEWSDRNPQTEAGEFGVKFFLPVDIYQKTTRSAKYAVAVLGLVFLIFFLVEAAARRRVNPLQYILVGLALCIFYTLLLSLSEQIAFQYAYLIASAAIVGMIGLFTKSILHSWRFGFIAGGVLVLLYGFIFILLQSEDYTLLAGSIGLFIILGVIMYFSRYANWYGDDKEKIESSAN